MPITSSPRPITVNRSLSLPTYTCTTASYPCLPFLVTPCSSLSLPTAPYHSLPLSIHPTAFYHSPLCPIISNLFLSPPIAFYPSQPQRITPHRVKIFFSNTPDCFILPATAFYQPPPLPLPVQCFLSLHSACIPCLPFPITPCSSYHYPPRPFTPDRFPSLFNASYHSPPIPVPLLLISLPTVSCHSLQLYILLRKINISV